VPGAVRQRGSRRCRRACRHLLDVRAGHVSGTVDRLCAAGTDDKLAESEMSRWYGLRAF
jgi:hypothetical protein